MDSDDRFSPRCDTTLDVSHVEVVRTGTQIREDRHRLLVKDANNRSDVGDWRGDDFVAETNASSGNRNVKRSRSGRTAVNVLQGAEKQRLEEEILATVFGYYSGS